MTSERSWRLLTLALVALATTVNTSALAADSIYAKVTYVGTYGDGALFVNLDREIDEPTCVAPRFDVEPTHPQIKQWQAVAMLALATNQTVRVKTVGCYNSRPTMGRATSSYFYIGQ